MLIDSHCHINSEELRADAEALVLRAAGAGVGRILLVGCDLENSLEAVQMAHRFADRGAWACTGIHPHEASRFADGLPDALLELAGDDRVCALGEMGLDYYYDLSPHEVQREVFRRQLEWAAEADMPVVLHVREARQEEGSGGAMEDALAILGDFPGLRLLFHCYSGGLKYLDEVLSRGALCALGGAATWKGRGSDALREVLQRVPEDRLLLETDCPWMAPAPFRGKLNEPSWVARVYETAAQVRGVSVDVLARQVAHTAARFFNWGEEDHV